MYSLCRARHNDYVSSYATEAGLQPIQACMDVLKRTCDVVELILTEAGKLSLQTVSGHNPT
jgi:hypothetical protein